jgi:ATP-dependent Clp protease ATP-binding subunit ClpA
MPHSESTVAGDMGGKLTQSGGEAAKRKFTPAFMNRLDKIVTF